MINSLRELQGWNLARLTHLPGDRRDHFETSVHVWELLRTSVRERQRREIGPTMQVLTELLADPAEACRRASKRCACPMRQWAWAWVMRPTGWAPLRPALDLAYRLFACQRMAISGASGPLITAIRTLRAGQRARQADRRMRECREACNRRRGAD